jgi:hypothetical protein
MARKKKRGKAVKFHGRHRFKRRRPYPDPDEWQHIVDQRYEILGELIPQLVTNDVDAFDHLVNRYGAQNVLYVLEKFQASSQRDLMTDEATIYRDYRRLFAQFGGDRPFLSSAEYEDFDLPLMAERVREEWARDTGLAAPQASVRLTHLAYATDITPPAIPPKPADFTAPVPAHYSSALRPLLRLGWKLKDSDLAPHLKRPAKWRRYLPELAQMAVDPGLVGGWPGEAASWAPYHALALLGHLRVVEYAGNLLALLDVENDWLSDRLPYVWAQMGVGATPPLWDYLKNAMHDEEKRSVALAGLLKIGNVHAGYRDEIIEGLASLLETNIPETATLNAYLVYALDELAAEIAIPVIEAAYDQGKIDTHVIAKDGVGLLGAEFDW